MNSLQFSNFSLDSTLDPKDEPIDTIIDIQENEIIFPVKEEPVYASEAEENLKLHIHETPFRKLLNTNPDLLNEDIEFPTNSLPDDKSIIHSANSAKPNDIPQTKLEPSEIIDIEEKEYVPHNTKAGGVRRRSQCEVCQKVVAAAALSYHMRIHTGEKSFVCTYCGKQFRRAQLLKSHEMVHTGEKPHACEVCGKRFTSKTYLKNHTNAIHGGEKFVCNLCQKSFAFSTSLSSHMKIHNRDKKFNCTLCNYSCIQNRYLKIHMLKHTKEKKFQCAACSFKFGVATSLKSHVLRYCKGEPNKSMKSKNDENPKTTGTEEKKTEVEGSFNV